MCFSVFLLELWRLDLQSCCIGSRINSIGYQSMTYGIQRLVPWDSAFSSREPEETATARLAQLLPATDPPVDPITEPVAEPGRTEPVIEPGLAEPIAEPVDDEGWADFAVSSMNKRGNQ